MIVKLKFIWTYISLLELLLLVIQASLDNLSPSEKTFLETSKSFVLDLDCCLLLKFLVLLETNLLKDWCKVILLNNLIGLLILLVVKLHLFTSLLEYRLLKNSFEDLLRIWRVSELMNVLLVLMSENSLAAGSGFLEFDLLVTLHFQIIDLPSFLLLLSFFLLVTVWIVDLGITEKFGALPFFLV